MMSNTRSNAVVMPGTLKRRKAESRIAVPYRSPGRRAGPSGSSVHLAVVDDESAAGADRPAAPEPSRRRDERVCSGSSNQKVLPTPTGC